MTSGAPPPSRRLVVDASVVLKWQLDDEPHIEQAQALRHDFLVAGTVELHSPNLLLYELTNVIHGAGKRARLPEDLLQQALANLVESGITLHEATPAATLTTARRFDLSGYDAAYLALAQSLGMTLCTGDGPLFRNATTRGADAIWIGDYAPVAPDG